MKRTLCIATTLLALAACASEPPKTLDQKLTAATPAERKETLRLACLNEAEWPASLQKVHATGRHGIQQRQKLKHTPEITEMKSLCRQMDDLTTADAKKLPPKELATACAAKVTAKKKKESKGWAEHAARIEKICEEMTDQLIKTAN